MLVVRKLWLESDDVDVDAIEEALARRVGGGNLGEAPLEIVHDRETGLVVAPDAIELARACAYVTAHADEAVAWGRAGKTIAERVTWNACIDALLA